MLLSLAASKAAASCFASLADLDSCASAPPTKPITNTAARAPWASLFMGIPPRTAVFKMFYHSRGRGSSALVGRDGSLAGRSDEQRLLVVCPRARPSAPLTNDAQGGAKGGEQGGSLAGGPDHGSLDRVERLAETVDQRGEYPIDALDLRGDDPIRALDLRRRERSRSRCVAADGVQVAHDGLQLVVRVIDKTLDPPG